MGKKNIIIVSSLILILGFSFAFQDSDLDGVEDSVDKCPDTPLLALVDKYGCPIEEEYKQIYERKKRLKLYLKFGFSHSKGDYYESNSFSLSFAFSLKPLYFSVTNRYYLYTSFAEEGWGDTSLYGSYTVKLSRSLILIPGIRIRLPTGKENLSSGRTDITPSFILNLFKGRWDLFSYISYSFRGGGDRKNVLFLSTGTGYVFSENLYANLSLDFSESTVRDIYNTYLSLFLIYDITERFYTTFNYSRGLSEGSTNNSVSLRFGIRF